MRPHIFLHGIVKASVQPSLSAECVMCVCESQSTASCRGGTIRVLALCLHMRYKRQQNGHFSSSCATQSTLVITHTTCANFTPQKHTQTFGTAPSSCSCQRAVVLHVSDTLLLQRHRDVRGSRASWMAFSNKPEQRGCPQAAQLWRLGNSC
jgi:hypothetical protein